MNSLRFHNPEIKTGICYSENLSLVDLVSDLGQGEFLPGIFRTGLRVYVSLVFKFYDAFFELCHFTVQGLIPLI